MKSYLSVAERLKLGARLADYHKLFYVFFELASVAFSDELKTAGVYFVPDGKPELVINEQFWDELTEKEKLFVICHECLHVMLEHGIRNGMDVKGATHDLVNIAQDITINEMIVSVFGFRRDDLREWKKYCWIETCFSEPSKVKRNETFVYYLELLIKEKAENKSPAPKETLDEHQEPGKGNGDPSDRLQPGKAEDAARAKVVEELAGEMTVEELEKLIDTAGGSIAGTEAGGLEIILEQKRKARRYDFNKLLKKLKRTRLKPSEADVDTFARENRRLGVLDRRLSLPGTGVKTKPSKDKLFVKLFMDISGSCLPYVKTFWQVVQSFAADEEHFDVELFTFDTVVRPIAPNAKIYGGGGTAFDIIESWLQAKDQRYPDCVVIVTDGFGTPVRPQMPERWVWLITPDDVGFGGSQLQFVHPKSTWHRIDNLDFT